MKKGYSLRVGIIGVGSMGRHHVRVYHELGVNIVGVTDADSGKARKIAAQYGTKAYSGYIELLNQGLDAVSIAVPTIEHKAVALAAIEQGVNLLIEKPIADSVVSAREILSAAEKKKMKLLVGHIERFNPVVQGLKQIMDEGILGRLILISARRVGPFVSRIGDTGIIVDVATHDIDISRYLVGKECTSVFARATRYKNIKGDAALILIDFGGVFASIEVNWYTPHKVRSLSVTGTRGIAYLDYLKQEFEVHNTKGSMIPEIEREEPLRRELVHFLDCITGNKQPLVSGHDGLKVLEIAARAEQIALEQKENSYEPER